MALCVKFLCLLLCCLSIFSVLVSAREDLTNICIDSKHHKSVPGPEAQLYDQCTPWHNRSCCTPETTARLHEQALYSMDYNHCPSKGDLSPACLRHFNQDHCFYECSPNVGPWVVKEPHRSWRNERYYGVPLCAADCDAWFNDCKEDFTCTDNWSLNFDWINLPSAVQYNDGRRCKNNEATCKVNVCPRGAACVTFAQMYGNASNFCQTVWDGSWRYTPNDQPCFRLWFNGAVGNPNDAVADLYSNRLANSAVDLTHGAGSTACLLLLLVTALL